VKLPPRRWPEAALTLARTFGARGGALRALHEARRAAGAFRERPRHPLSVPSDRSAPAAHPFRVDPARLAAATDRAEAAARGERVAGGEYQAYRWEWRRFPADAAGWNRHPRTGARFAPDAPWWKVEHLDPAAGDIKDVWEPGRFTWAYDLVRAWLVTGDARFARAFHARFGQWRESSPPFRGAQWACGQETAIRAAALLYAEANLPATPEESAALAGTLAASGERIADALGYAVSQRNNHAISEATGLLLLGERLAGAHPEAAEWSARGARWVERLVMEQFAADGWYVQHSFTYLRVALDQCVLAQRSLARRGRSLSSAALARIEAAVRLLCAVIDPATGQVPNHGASDGAFVHPVTLAPYRDFRPLLTAVCATFGLPLPAGLRPDAETLAWLGAAEPARGPALGDGVWSGVSGWAAARAGGTAVFLRAGRYRARPAHLDALHLDVRAGGREVVVDPGTFAYNAPPPWRNGLAGAAVHNGPVVDGAEPGVRGPRFLWYLWPRAELLEAKAEGGAVHLAARIPGRVRRDVRVSGGAVEVTDRVLDAAAARLSVRWTLHPGAPVDAVRVDGPSRVREAAEGDTAGWYSPRYGERLATRCVEAERERPRPLEVRTRISAPGETHDDRAAGAQREPALLADR